MKQIFILRHAQKSILTGGITKKGEEQCKELAKILPTFGIGIASEKKRTQETVLFLTNTEPIIDNKANLEHESGNELITLIKETMKKLQQNQNAIIISHSPSMTAAYHLLTKETISFGPLEGFKVDDKMKIKKV
ncbi:MAG: phosphoglycerate mutase family protein [Candidatus Woesearchaeota archaeon]|jgi:phosphohistidine phosphatase SixA